MKNKKSFKTGTEVGEGIIIAAGAIVIGEIESSCIHGRVLAKLLKYRNES